MVQVEGNANFTDQHRGIMQPFPGNPFGFKESSVERCLNGFPPKYDSISEVVIP